MTHSNTDSAPEAIARRIDDLEQILTRMDDGFYRVDLEGVIQRHNPAFAQILGFDPDRDLTGAKTPDFWRDPADRQPYLDRLMGDGAIHNLEVAARRVDGTPIVVLLSAHLIRDADGAPAAIEGTVRDVSDHKAAELALRERIKELDCLQDIGKAIEAHGADSDAVMQQAVEILARSWMHADVTVARIRLDDVSYHTGDLDACAAVQAADLVVDGQVRGAVEVGYTQARPQQDEGPFLAEERALIDAVAERLGHVVERLEYERLAELERSNLQAVFDGIDDVIYVADPDTYELLHVNETARRIWGADIVGQKCYRVLQNRDSPCPFCTNDEIFGDKLGETKIWEFQNEVTGDWYRCLDKAIRWTDGRWVRFELASDITEQKKTDQSLRASEERFRRIAENSPDMIYCMSLPDGVYEYVSPAAERVFGHPSEVFYQTPLIIREAIHPDFQEYFATEWEKLLADQAPPTYEYKIVRPDGRTGWLNQRNVIMRDEDGRPNAIWGIVTDITERKEAEQRVADEEFKVRTFLDNTADLITVVDAQGRLTYVNKVAEQIYGLPAEKLLGTSAFERIHPDDQPATQEAFQGWLANKVEHASWENRQVSTTGEIRPMLWTIMPRYVDGALDSIWSIGRDITDIKKAQAALERHKAHLEDEVAQRTAELRRKTALTDAINRVFREALSCETEEQVAQAALRVAEEVTGSKFGFIGVVNDAGTFDTIGLSNPGWDACDVPGSSAALLIRGMELRGIWATVLRTGRSQIVNDPTSHPDRVGVPPGHPPLTAFLGAPFKQADRAVGMIALANKDGGYGPEDQEALEALSGALHEVLVRKRMEIQLQRQARIQAGLAELGDRMLGDQPVEPLCTNVISFLCGWLEAPTGLLYLSDRDGTLRLAGSHAHRPDQDPPRSYRPGEGLVGQAAVQKEPFVLDDLPEDYIRIESGLGATRPRSLLIAPVLLNDRVLAVVELGALKLLGDDEQQFLKSATESIGYALESALARDRQARLLEESQQMTEELQTQQEELRTANEELEEQTQRLAASEASLKAQQEEMQVTNEELEEKTELLGRQKQEVERARREISATADELALASQYKSEFLANMSHELRTPLNSLLLLARSLKDNKPGNLSADQVESASVIYDSGNALLSLINEILDLSKIEAGRMELSLDEVRVSDLADAVQTHFGHLAADRGLDLQVRVAPGAPEAITSDRQRVEQVLRNLIANAIKFTRQGGVTVTFGPARLDDEGGADRLAIAVADTGIGISPDQQQLIFEAFRQVDGSTARRYEGTGLGLSISKELVHLLGGSIDLRSEPGQGSTFTVVLPMEGPGAALAPRPEPHPAPSPPPAAPVRPSPAQRPPAAAAVVPDDREDLGPGDRSVLIIEDDARFAAALSRQCREQGLKVLAAGTGEDGLSLAGQYGPTGIVLDLKLPGMDGWRVLELLKDNPATRHIPVHIMSVDEPSPRALRQGAVGYLQKPLTREQIGAALDKMAAVAAQGPKRVLVVEDDPAMRRGIVELIADEGVETEEVAGGQTALAALRAGHFDCMILDLGLSDMDGGDLLERIDQDADIQAPPVIVYTGRDLSWEEDMALRSYSESIIVKGVRSDERLLDEVSLFLHRVVADMPAAKRQVITDLHDANALLAGKRVLVVDDDMRTLFALSRILADRGMQVVKAENGAKALELLDGDPGVDLVLMDIMMPVLDGYATMKRIRAQERFAKLPIIALTAKAMKGDQERCIQAGASDYLPKPVDQDRLVSMLRVWLYR